MAWPAVIGRWLRCPAAPSAVEQSDSTEPTVRTGTWGRAVSPWVWVTATRSPIAPSAAIRCLRWSPAWLWSLPLTCQCRSTEGMSWSTTRCSFSDPGGEEHRFGTQIDPAHIACVGGGSLGSLADGRLGVGGWPLGRHAVHAASIGLRWSGVVPGSCQTTLPAARKLGYGRHSQWAGGRRAERQGWCAGGQAARSLVIAADRPCRRRRSWTLRPAAGASPSAGWRPPMCWPRPAFADSPPAPSAVPWCSPWPRRRRPG
jgi:hypothetical protein